MMEPHGGDAVATGTVVLFQSRLFESASYPARVGYIKTKDVGQPDSVVAFVILGTTSFSLLSVFNVLFSTHVFQLPNFLALSFSLLDLSDFVGFCDDT